MEPITTIILLSLSLGAYIYLLFEDPDISFSESILNHTRPSVTIIKNGNTERENFLD
jgi:hypothetical protein